MGFGQNQAVRDSVGHQKKEDKALHNTVQKLAFRPLGHQPDQPALPDFKPYTGKIIRNIHIESLDPFGYSVTDSTQKPHSWLEKTGNKLHAKSKAWPIRKFLMIEKGDSLDTLLIAETDRLLREQDYVREVRIIPQPLGADSDSVDLAVRVLDSWSLVPKGSFSGSQTKFGIEERNFLGMGHRIDLLYSKRLSDHREGLETSYTIPNIMNSFIDVKGRYALYFDKHYDLSLSIDREFFSPLTRWAGGIFFQKRSLGRLLPDDMMDFNRHDIKFLYRDFWGGYAVPVFKGNSERERTTNLVFSLRSLALNYSRTPSEEFDPAHFFADENFYLGSIGLSSRQYIKDHFIFRDGEIEDVPVGVVYSLTGGVQHKNYKDRMYLGARGAYGNYFEWGYFSGNFEAGSFFHGSDIQQTTLSVSAGYFSPLLDLGRGWQMRQFAKPQFVLGFNRSHTVADRLSLNEVPYFSGVNGLPYLDYNNGSIQGFDSPVFGKQKYVLDFQTQVYATWEWLEFHYNPYSKMRLGLLTNDEIVYGDNNLYAAFGLGMIIRNDYLVFHSLQLSLTYFPEIPGQGN